LETLFSERESDISMNCPLIYKLHLMPMCKIKQASLKAGVQIQKFSQLIARTSWYNRGCNSFET